MSNSTPHWQSDDGDPVPVRVVEKAPAGTVPLSSISRRPAAIIGILAVAAAGIAMFYGGALQGQVVSGILVRITPEGVVPAIVTVQPGDVVQWRNDDRIPHILASSTLATEDVSPMESTPIFPGDTFTATIRADATPGNHTYFSRTAALEGTVVVGTTTAPSPTAQTNSRADLMPQAELSIPQEVDSDAPAMPNTGIPVNPYTVSTADNRPPLIDPQTSRPAITRTVTRPPSQPSSGAAAWAVTLASAVAVAFVWRRALAR